MKPKNILILGSTGSIGINALKVVERYPQRFQVIGLTAYNNFRLLTKQVQRFNPKHVAVGRKGVDYLKKNIDTCQTQIWDVHADLEVLTSLKDVDVVIIGMRGGVALKPFLSAVRAGKVIAPANKEALVVAGEILMTEAKKYGAQIIPVDSEQSAIFQCLQGQNQKELKKVHLTASGGALLRAPTESFDKITVAQILKHPRWRMGKKITVDSASLMNKGFEVIEAMRLFNLSVEQIDVLVHPEAIIHSMVEFMDGSVIAQCGITDMRLPIQYALTYPERWSTGLKSLNFAVLKQLNFEKPDMKKFPSLKLAIDVAKKGGTYPSVLNAADEEAVEAFLQEKISFPEIYRVVEKTIRRHHITTDPSIEDILQADQWAREQAHQIMEKTI